MILGPRLGSSFKTHARLLSSGFCRRVYASLASRQRTRSSRTDVGPLCRGPRLFVYVSRPRLMALVRTLPPPPLHLRPDVLHLWNILKSPFRLDARSLDRPIPPPRDHLYISSRFSARNKGYAYAFIHIVSLHRDENFRLLY